MALNKHIHDDLIQSYFLYIAYYFFLIKIYLNNKKFSSLFVAFLALCGLLAGCAGVPEKSPDTKGKILVELDHKKHVIKAFAGNTSGSWAEAIIYEVSEVPAGCYSHEDLDKVWTKREWTGWIKVLDDNGQPHEIGWGGIC